MGLAKDAIAEFILGYSFDGQSWYSIEDIKGILGNATAMLEDEQDGIEAVFERRKNREFKIND